MRRITITTIPCNICGGTLGRVLINCSNYDIVTCNQCGLVFVDSQFDDEQLQKFYTQDYYTGKWEKVYKDYISEQEQRIKAFRARLMELRKYSDSGRLLEVGCAAGFFLKVASDSFEVQGIELSEFSSEYGRKTLHQQIHTGSVFSADLQPNDFDVVVMWDVIEHLADPRATLMEIRRTLKRGGILGLSTGNIGSFRARWNLGSWKLLAPPWHLYYYSKKTLCYLLRELRYEVLHLRTNGLYTYSKNRVCNNSLFRRLVRLVRQGDIMTVYCRKETNGESPNVQL
ncbi:MAG: class I SAM-dependent methyltransferase [Desulfobacteraceae bacterium]|nr:class I SAM-dependent methyltransferase [Desulfobacteraceae bacterium]